MILAVDIETDLTPDNNFILGSLVFEDGRPTEFFYKKEDLFNRIVEIAKKQVDRNRNTLVYSHFAPFDFYRYVPLDCVEVLPTNRVFQAKMKVKGSLICNRTGKIREGYIRWLDTMNLYRMSLEELGTMLGLPKMPHPDYFDNKDVRITPELIESIKPYCERDSQICIKSILDLKKSLQKLKIKPQVLLTPYTIALTAFKQYALNHPTGKKLYDGDSKSFIQTPYKERIAHAYKGGRVEIFKYQSPSTTLIDINSFYPYCATKIRFPNLQTEYHLNNPNDTLTIEHLTRNPGASLVLLQNKSADLPCVPVNTPLGAFYPRKGQYLISWIPTNELKYALDHGYKLIASTQSIQYEEMDNMFIDWIPPLYKLKQHTGNKMEKYIYKQILNGIYGKLGQWDTFEEIRQIPQEDLFEWIEKGFVDKQKFGRMIVMAKTQPKVKHKNYAIPILPSLVTAESRLRLHKEMTRLDINQLCRVDTDSILFEDNGDLEKFDIGKEMGQFKVVSIDEPFEAYSKKAYKLGRNWAISGIPKKTTIDNIQDIKYKEIMKDPKKYPLDQLGKWINLSRNLIYEKEEALLKMEVLKSQTVLIDERILDDEYRHDMSLFLPHLMGKCESYGFLKDK